MHMAVMAHYNTEFSEFTEDLLSEEDLSEEVSEEVSSSLRRSLRHAPQCKRF